MPNAGIALEIFLIGVSGTFIGMVILYLSMRLLSAITRSLSEEEKK